VDATIIRWTLNCGRGTNTRVGLLGAWATLMIASHLTIPRIDVKGDSKVVIDWILNKGRLHVCLAERWKDRIISLSNKFESISYQRIAFKAGF